MRYGHRLAIAAFVALAVLGVLVVLAAVEAPAGSAAPLYASSESTSTAPAPLATVRWAKGWRRAAIRELVRLNDYRSAFKLPLVKFPKCDREVPPRAAPQPVWLEAGRAWRYDARTFHAAADRLHARMTSTKGGGALRWRPLIRYWWPEWSESQVYLMAHILWHESSGRPFAWNGAGSGAFGLFQLLPRPAGVWDVWSQARAARLIKYDHGGLAHWAGCRAFSCPGGCGIY